MMSLLLALLLVVPTGSKVIKVESIQHYSNRAWVDFDLGKTDTVTLDGQRTLYFIHNQIRCSKSPEYIQMRFARHHADGSLDTTGTQTWFTHGSTLKKFTLTQTWTMKTKYPVSAQVKVAGGKCWSSERQFKWWQP